MADTTAKDMLAYAKSWLRISAASQDDEITQTLEAGALDLQAAGVRVDLNDSLIRQALKLYLKASYGNDERRAEWAAAYEALKGSLSLAAAYTCAGGAADDGSGD
ncbi:hypothetical protein [Galactobacillus timonensis]|uniref:hypothetical protein n=1 Tax=Galactobacillus timonensis TaxID=2041840 RepID=UPI000C81495D|nr:hypothetical protein [Galactobacillus timonensis]